MEALSSPQVVKDIRRFIDNDEWAWMVCWGPPRLGKSTLCMDIAYQIYMDWGKVLDCQVFNLSQTIYKIKHGIPERWPTRNLLHMRVPLLIWEDFGAYCNKAITQHDPAWDYFKGAFDTLGTKVAVIIANMQEPTSPTQQLLIKFTHELWVHARGKCKYDQVTAHQDYRGWGSRHKKEWLQDFDFPPIEMDTFKEYDESRMSLADEVLQKVEDCIVDTHLPNLVKKMQPLDVAVMRLIYDKGMVYNKILEEEFGDTYRPCVIRLKSRQLITPVRVKGHYYKYDITPLGVEVLKALEKQTDKKDVKIPTF